jgi:undecaprenyl-diphosphatase
MTRRGVALLAGGIALGAWTAFAVLALAVAVGHGSPLFLDDALLSWSVGHRPDMAVAVARGLTGTGTGVIPYTLVVLAGLLAGRTPRGRLLCALLAVACLAVGQAARYGVMELVARTRPPASDWQAPASGWAFPSGHTTTAALAAGLVILVLCVRAPRCGTALCLIVGCWGALVGLTRVYLGVHWFTDVLGGWLFALGWLAVCLCAAARWLPARLITDPPGTTPATDPPPTGHSTHSTNPTTSPSTHPADAPAEEHAPQDPGRRGRSRPA